MKRRAKNTAETLSDYLREAGSSLFSIRNSFAPLPGKKMSEAEKALLADLYNRTRKALLDDEQDETVAHHRIFP